MPSPSIMDKNDTVIEFTGGVIHSVLDILVFVMAIAGMILNTTTILALLHLPWSSRPNLRLVLSLCAANFLFAFNFIIYMIAFFCNPLQSGYVVTCLMFEVLRCVLYLYIYFNIASIVLDLCMAVTNPLGYASIVNQKRTNKVLIINAFISLVIMALAVIFNYLTLSETTDVHKHESSCSIYPSYVYIRSFNWIFKVSVFICIPVFLVLLIIIFLAVKATNSSSNSQPSNTRGVITVILVVFTFLFCFAPYQFVSFYTQYSPESYKNLSTLAQTLERLFYLYGFFVPMLYSVRMTDVRKGYTLMFKRCVSAASDYQSVFTGE